MTSFRAHDEAGKMSSDRRQTWGRNLKSRENMNQNLRTALTDADWFSYSGISGSNKDK